MDIQRWLHDTADRAPPDPSDDLPVPAFLRSPREAENHTRKYRRKRKRAASDSSIISQQQDFHQLGVSARPANRRRRDGRSRHSEGFARSIDSGSRYAEKRSPARSSDPGDPSRPADNPYERRARHKTKADRYQPKKEKGRQKKDDEPHAHKSKQERRKSHRSGDGGRTAGLIQSFQLKNGPKNNRLTASTSPVCCNAFTYNSHSSSQTTMPVCSSMGELQLSWLAAARAVSLQQH